MYRNPYDSRNFTGNGGDYVIFFILVLLSPFILCGLISTLLSAFK